MNVHRIRDLALPPIGLPPRSEADREFAQEERRAGRFNLFQRMMLRWSELHPYNPVHVVRVPRALDPQRLRNCIAERLGSAGLTGLTVDRARWRFHFEGGAEPVDLSVGPAGEDAIGALSRAIEHEFNLPFAPAEHVRPFRFRALHDGDAFLLALTYDHFVAGGDAVARLLTGIARAYCGHATTPSVVVGACCCGIRAGPCVPWPVCPR
jgi:hypothetical protein